MSYTPRTDHEEAIDNGDTKPLLNSMRQLERELSAAIEREKAMDRLHQARMAETSEGIEELRAELNAAQAENVALRETVKEAYKTLHDIVFNRECGFEIDLKCENTIAKLQPYLK